MKIGLNATCLNDRPSGAKQRFVGIYREIVKKMPEDEFVVYESSDCSVSSWFNGAPNVSFRHTSIPSEGRALNYLSGLGYWPGKLLKENFDIFEGFHQPLVKAPTGRTLLTIHDIRRAHPDWSDWDGIIYKLALERDLRKADHVITVSEAMKEEILKIFPSVSISVIYNGLETYLFDTLTDLQLQTTKQKHNFPENFVLAVGHYEKRKNYPCLIDAIAKLRDQGRICCLVIVGNDSGERKAIEQRVQSAGLSGQVQILSGLTDIEVRCAYKLCNLFVFPSSYEGFGIPLLEAMASGCPMVMSDIPVFREITQNSYVYFPHNDAEAMAFAIEKVLKSSIECERQIKYGYERVQAFNFESLADRLVNLYRQKV